jgi:tetratricopeptide (TPR) repeat protein
MWTALAVSLVVASAGCKDKPKQHDPRAEADKPVSQESACDGAEPDEANTLRWFHDDYNTALACAAEREVPLIIDMWAPWCHTCLSMKHFVLIDKSLAPLSERFVWLAVDTDKEVNAPVSATYTQTAWPTFFAVSPDSEAIQGRHVGSASIRQFREFLVQAEKNHRADKADRGDLDPVANALREGDREAIVGHYTKAKGHYLEALEKSKPNWSRRPEVLVSLIGAYYKGKDYPGCVDLAEKNLDKTGSAASAADFAYYSNECAGEIKGDDRRVKALRGKLLSRVMEVVDDEGAPLSVDDRSDALRVVRELHLALDDESTAKQIAERQLNLLERAASKAPNDMAAMTYNWPRAEVHVYLERGEQLIPALVTSAEALPKEYDPPYRLGWVYFKLGKHAEALQHTKKALALVYGPRKARVQGLIASIHEARGDVTAERQARAAVLKIYQDLPEGQKSPKREKAAKEALEALNAKAREAAKKS